MSYMFEKNYDDSTDDQGEASLEPLGSAIDPPYHDYLATYVFLERLASRRRAAIWIGGGVLVTLCVAALSLAVYMVVGG